MKSGNDFHVDTVTCKMLGGRKAECRCEALTERMGTPWGTGLGKRAWPTSGMARILLRADVSLGDADGTSEADVFPLPQANGV